MINDKEPTRRQPLRAIFICIVIVIVGCVLIFIVGGCGMKYPFALNFYDDQSFIWERVQKKEMCNGVTQPKVKIVPNLHKDGVYMPASHTILLKDENYDVLEKEIVKACRFKSGKTVYEYPIDRYSGKEYGIR